MSTLGNHPFVNRDSELAYLSKHLKLSESCIIFVRAPTGFGKTSLTDEALRRGAHDLPVVAIVDANVRTSEASLHDGYFIQRAVQALQDIATPTFSEFVRRRAWRNIREKKASDAVRRYPNATALYAYLVDYVDRLTGKGAYSPKELVSSDANHAVQICREYLSSIAEVTSILIVLRETQHIDLESLSFFVRLQQEARRCHLLVEYTTDTPAFSSDHAKVLQRELCGYDNVHILDLQPLGQNHLEYLLRSQFDKSVTISSEFYGRWDGNLRTLSELKYRVGIPRKIESSADLVAALPNLQDHLEERIRSLSRHDKFLLVAISCHVSPIHQATLTRLVRQWEAVAAALDLGQHFKSLSNQHRLVHSEGEYLRIENDDITSAIERVPECRGLSKLAAEYLKKIYIERLREADYVVESAAVCLRQAVNLSAETKEIGGLIELIPQLTDAIGQSNDQAAFVEIISRAIFSVKTGFSSDLDSLTEWAAAIAYDTGNFSEATILLAQRWRKSPWMALVYVAGLLETNGHDVAEDILDEAQAIWPTGRTRVGIELSRAMLARFNNHPEEARDRLAAIVSDSKNQQDPLVAFAHRFFESVSEFPTATRHALDSAQIFAQLGLTQPEAYSRLAASMHIAREGNVVEAIEQINRAEVLLDGTPSAAYVVLNNRAATLLNSFSPEYSACAALLSSALDFARDEFAMTVILSNQAVCYWQLDQLVPAVKLARRALAILEDPSYRDRDLQWSAGFNIASVLQFGGFAEEATDLRNRITTQENEPIVYPEYWRRRFELSKASVNPKFDHMLCKPYHPLFLSHWQLDRMGLHDLTSESQQ
ncbi:MAG: hypothetical protein AAF542_20015 [Pseudomonadota bacterium]